VCDAGKVLEGRRILVVEDEMLIAMELEGVLEDEGCIAVGPAPTVCRALGFLDREPVDAAILDLNLDGKDASPVALALAERGVPFVVASGYGGAEILQPALKAAPRVDKPVDHRRLVCALIRILTSK
jgi:DNA-binding NtrC family response regulator